MTDLVAAVSQYADRFHRSLPPGHQVASPLGAWLLLAVTAPAATGRDHAQLAALLGMDIPAAADAAAELLAHPHPAVGSAVALWQRVDIATEASRTWAGGLPPEVEQGGIPTQQQADEWAREHTFGLIDRFPLDMAPAVVMVLASALATRVSWAEPFGTAPAAALGDSPWAHQVHTVLRKQGGRGHRAFLARSGRAAEVAVHVASAEGLRVAAVIADADTEAPDVLAAAHEIATGGGQRIPLAELPLGRGHSWTITERTEASSAPERYISALPAWAAHSDHDLRAPGFGLGIAAGVLNDLLGGGLQWDARQSAMARYTREGFEAAAVTGMFMRTSAMIAAERTVRTAELRFAHPFAVVATCTGGGPWDGLPVFSAWVAQPSEA